jgi:DNA-binding GntR family transcriptional regulator
VYTVTYKKPIIRRVLREGNRAGTLGSSNERVYSELREAIVTGQLEPGTRVVEVDVARRYDVSRTPVREALKRLLAERLLERHPRVGLIVRDAEEPELDEVFALREVLDGLASRLAANRISDEELIKLALIHGRFGEAVAAERAEQCAAINIAFHDAIYAAAANRVLTAISRDLRDFVRQFSAGAAYFSDSQRMADVVHEHAAILAALQARNPADAEAAARYHIRTSRGKMPRRPAPASSGAPPSA